MKIVQFMTSPLGRGLRIVLGSVVIAMGLFVVGGTLGTIMAIVGIVPLAGCFYSSRISSQYQIINLWSTTTPRWCWWTTVCARSSVG